MFVIKSKFFYSKNYLFKGVPISSQWNKKGHIYPVQVSQFGLSYFSKWVTNAYSSKHQFFFINHSQISLPEDVNTFINPIKHGFEFKTNGIK